MRRSLGTSDAIRRREPISGPLQLQGQTARSRTLLPTIGGIERNLNLMGWSRQAARSSASPYRGCQAYTSWSRRVIRARVRIALRKWHDCLLVLFIARVRTQSPLQQQSVWQPVLSGRTLNISLRFDPAMRDSRRVDRSRMRSNSMRIAQVAGTVPVSRITLDQESPGSIPGGATKSPTITYSDVELFIFSPQGRCGSIWEPAGTARAAAARSLQRDEVLPLRVPMRLLALRLDVDAISQARVAGAKEFQAPSRRISRCRKHSTTWSLTIPTACMCA